MVPALVAAESVMAPTGVDAIASAPRRLDASRRTMREGGTMKIEEIEGVGPTYAAKLSGAGVLTTEHLLERGGSATGREALATETGQSHAQVLEWVNHVDLM